MQGAALSVAALLESSEPEAAALEEKTRLGNEEVRAPSQVCFSWTGRVWANDSFPPSNSRSGYCVPRTMLRASNAGSQVNPSSSK